MLDNNATAATDTASGDTASGTFVIGLALASDGPHAALSRELRAAINQLVDTNRGSATPAVRAGMVVRVIEDHCSAEGGTAAATQLVAENVRLVVGHPCSNAAIAAARVYATAGVPFLAVGARHPDLTAKRAGPMIFRLGGRDDRQASDTVAAIAAAAKGKRVAIVHDRTRYARSLATEVGRGLQSAGAHSVTIQGIVAGEQEYPTLTAWLQSHKPELVYFSGYPAEAAIVATSLSANRIGAIFVLSDAVSVDPAHAPLLPKDLRTWRIETTIKPEQELAATAANSVAKMADILRYSRRWITTDDASAHSEARSGAGAAGRPQSGRTPVAAPRPGAAPIAAATPAGVTSSRTDVPSRGAAEAAPSPNTELKAAASVPSAELSRVTGADGNGDLPWPSFRVRPTGGGPQEADQRP
jgi:ABC-type branched-subunit amino acid transport system substrate-binding protein